MGLRKDKNIPPGKDYFGAYFLSVQLTTQQDRDQRPLWVLEYESFRLLGTLHTALRHDTHTRHLFWASGAISGLATATNSSTTPKITHSWFKAMYLRLVTFSEGVRGTQRPKHIGILAYQLDRLCATIGLARSACEKTPLPMALSRLSSDQLSALGYLTHLSSAWLIADTLQDGSAQKLLEAELACAVRRLGTEQGAQ